ncbi:hypothetical protein [Leifsonia sp. AG29]|uniref:hypothetical protein n=1 Tax=Leifsonia sp. AG29 TaxID=2598860 RepID=UPI00131D93BB|nr:hypothetical protein [Leifsonia sp. AG29]
MVADDEQASGRAEGFDPRYDPAFQRGYRALPGESPRTRRRPLPLDDQPPRPSRPAWGLGDDELDAAESPSMAIASLPEVAAEPARAIEPEREPAPAVVVAAPGLLDRIELSPRRNPVMLALWIVGAGFVVVGIVLYCVSVTVSYAGPTPNSDVGSLVFAQLGWMLAGPLITVGLVTIVGLLFLTAVAGRRPEAAPAEAEGGGEG